jgi:hypothetical protein
VLVKSAAPRTRPPSTPRRFDEMSSDAICTLLSFKYSPACVHVSDSGDQRHPYASVAPEVAVEAA